MSVSAGACATGQRSFSARPADPSNLRSPKRRAKQFRVGSQTVVYEAVFSFPAASMTAPIFSTRQYARIVDGWVRRAGLDSAAYGTHSMRRTKAAQIYCKTANLRAVQLLLGHSKLDYVPCRTMSRFVSIYLMYNATFLASGHSLCCHRLRRKARSLSSGRYRPGCPLRGATASRTCCFNSRLASR